MYDVAGASHSLPSAATNANCALPLARLDYRPIMRSSLANLDAWVSRGLEPPASVLMPLTADTVDDKVLRAPAHLPKAIVLAPARGADGNVAGGVRLPEVDVPLGVNAVQNSVDKDPCRLSAGYLAYPVDEVKKRYKSPAEYSKRIAASAAKLAERRLILPEDADAVVRAAQNVRWDD
jgi:hypothetical protein